MSRKQGLPERGAGARLRDATAEPNIGRPALLRGCDRPRLPPVTDCKSHAAPLSMRR
jgi:hypothetical protein